MRLIFVAYLLIIAVFLTGCNNKPKTSTPIPNEVHQPIPPKQEVQRSNNAQQTIPPNQEVEILNNTPPKHEVQSSNNAQQTIPPNQTNEIEPVLTPDLKSNTPTTRLDPPKEDKNKKWDEYFTVSVSRIKEDHPLTKPYVQVIILITRDVKLNQYSDDYEDDEAEMLAPIIEKLDLQFGDYECIFKSYDLDKFEEIKKAFMNSKMFFFSDNNLYDLIYNIGIVDNRPDDKSFYMKDRKFYINVTFLDEIIRIRGCSLTKKEQSKSFQFVKNGTTVIGNVPVRSINNVQYIEYKYYVENILPNLLYSDEFIEPDMSF